MEIDLKKLIGFILLTIIALNLIANDRPKVGLVLSGGGAKGVAHIGVLKVLEEHGIKPDYITGTSMGAIIGALYSIGYSAEELEKIVFDLNWPELMADRRERQNLSFSELENEGKYQLSFPLEKGRIVLPTGFVTGQNVISLLSTLTIPVHGIEDFNQLPIPFSCMGTNIETGEPVIMDHGILSEAIRSSMSIPSVFSPSEWEEYLLLDGGLVDNFPVQLVRDMGAEIIIGVDISSSIASRDELTNVISVINQAISYRGYASTEEQRKSCDLLITPNLVDYNIMSFDKLRDIYNIGEYATRQNYDELTALASILKSYDKEPVEFPDHTKREFLIRKIKVEGLESTPSYAVRGWLNIRTPSVVHVDKIEASIQRLVSSRNFEHVHYRLVKRERGDGFNLLIKLREKSNDSISLGGNFNSEDYASVLLQLKFQNLLKRGTSLNFDARLNPKAEIDIHHLFLSGWDYGVGLITGSSLNVSEIYKYKGHTRSGEPKFLSDISIYAGPTLLFNNIFSVSLLYSHDINLLESNSNLDNFNYVKHTDKIGLVIHRDFLDDIYFPSKGVWVYNRFENCFIEGLDSDFDDQVQRLIINNRSAVPITKNYSLQLGMNLGISTENNKLNNNAFYLGGNRLINSTTFPFPAMTTRKKKGRNIYVGKLGIQRSFHDLIFIGVNGYYGEVKDDITKLFKAENDMFGGSVDFGVRTILGAIQVSLQKNNLYKDFSGYFSIGYNY